MTVSEKNRKFFAGVGLEAIRREVTVGYHKYIPIDNATQAEAREWVAEREREILRSGQKSARTISVRGDRTI
jgi:hypothetical protein